MRLFKITNMSKEQFIRMQKSSYTEGKYIQILHEFDLGDYVDFIFGDEHVIAEIVGRYKQDTLIKVLNGHEQRTILNQSEDDFEIVYDGIYGYYTQDCDILKDKRLKQVELDAKRFGVEF